MARQCGKRLWGNGIQNITQKLELYEAAEENYWVAAVESFVFRYTRAPYKCPAIQKQ